MELDDMQPEQKICSMPLADEGGVAARILVHLSRKGRRQLQAAD